MKLRLVGLDASRIPVMQKGWEVIMGCFNIPRLAA